uniref:Prenyltransferase alpha-alpha toroid domain-containing protein n=1 Tax=Anopheles stephensi TaxID=30069 RepID=A0A182YBE6_ANOST
MSGIYWGVTGLDLMNELGRLDKQSIIDFVKKCQCPTTGGIAACEGHDPHILYTERYSDPDHLRLSGRDRYGHGAKYVASLQQLDGRLFQETSVRWTLGFPFCAVAILSLVRTTDAATIQSMQVTGSYV